MAYDDPLEANALKLMVAIWQVSTARCVYTLEQIKTQVGETIPDFERLLLWLRSRGYVALIDGEYELCEVGDRHLAKLAA